MTDDLLMKQLEICSEALSRIEKDSIRPLEQRPWVVARDALAACRALYPPMPLEVKSSRYSLEDVAIGRGET